MKLSAQTLHALRSLAMRQPAGETSECRSILLTGEEARELYEAYTTARMHESAHEHFTRAMAAAKTREGLLETQLESARVQLAATREQLAKANAAELRGAERLAGIDCTCHAFGGDAIAHMETCAKVLRR